MEQKASGPTAELARRDNEREEKERRKSMKKEKPTLKENQTGEQESSSLYYLFGRLVYLHS